MTTSTRTEWVLEYERECREDKVFTNAGELFSYLKNHCGGQKLNLCCSGYHALDNDDGKEIGTVYEREIEG